LLPNIVLPGKFALRSHITRPFQANLPENPVNIQYQGKSACQDDIIRFFGQKPQPIC